MSTPSELLRSVFSAEEFRKNGHALVDQLADYLKKCEQGEAMSVLPWEQPNDNLSIWTEDWKSTEKPSFEQLSAKILDASIHTHHPHYVGHQVVSPAPTAVLADFLASFINNGTAVYEMGPAAVPIERLLMQWLGIHFGFDKDRTDGVMVSGGSLGNLTALLGARQLSSGLDAWKEGNPTGKKLAVMVSEEAHYCVARAVQVMGLGEAGVIKVPANDNFQMDTAQLPRLYQEAQDRGIHVFAIVGSACTTSTGTYDPLDEIGDFCQKHGIWFHVDGAHGAAAAISPKYKHLLAGIEKADSVVIDFHKMMLTPSLTTAVVFRNGQDSFAAFAQKAAYLLDENEQHWYDLASRTIECTKKGMSFKPYMLLKIHGEQALADYVTYMYDLGKDFAEHIQSLEDFELQAMPMCNIVCFRYTPKGMNEERLNELNARIRQQIIEEGNFYCVHTVVRGKRYLRTALMNPLTSLDDLKELLAESRRIGDGFIEFLDKVPE